MEKRMLWIKLGTGALVILVLLTAGYFFSQFRPGIVVTPTPSPTTTVSPVPSIPTTPIDTTGWKTYINTKYNYRYEYPPNIFELEVTPFEPVTDTRQQVLAGMKEDNMKGVSITVQALLNEYDKCFGIEDCYDKLRKRLGRNELNSWGINRKIGDKFVSGFGYNFVIGVPDGKGYLVDAEKLAENYLLSNKRSDIYNVSIIVGGYSKEEIRTVVNPVVDAILGTFRFTK